MGFQSTFNRALGSVATITKLGSISEQMADKATKSSKEQIKSKQTGTKMSTRNTIQEVMKEATMGRLSDDQINTLAGQMNKKQRRQFKENYFKEVNTADDDQQ